MAQQNIWKEIKPGFEKALYTDLTEAYKSFIPKPISENNDKLVVSKDPIDNKEYSYKMKLNPYYKVYEVLRWEKRGGGSSQKYQPTISIGVELVDIDQANKKLKLNQDSDSGVYYRISGNPISVRELDYHEGMEHPIERDTVKVLLELVLKKTGSSMPEAPKPVQQGV